MDKIKLIIADDQVLFLKGLKLLISSFESIDLVGVARNGQELLEAIKKEIPDVVLIDLKMPVLDGIEATKIIKNQYPGIKIIFLSMHNDDGIINMVMSLGANGYLVKNEEPEILKAAIETVMEKDFYFNEYTSRALLKGTLQPSIRKGKSKLLDDLQLTRRELEIVKLICKEYTSGEIAKELFISIRTVEGHRKNILSKTGVRNIAGLVIFAMKNNLIKI
ncbi:MAG: response regulator transcription factor [Bacteroidota bacterium]